MADLFYAVEDGDVPPSYFESISLPSFARALLDRNSSSDHAASPSSSSSLNPNTTSTSLLPPSLTSSLTSPLSAHLQNLPIRMRAAQEARSTEQASRDLDIITLLVPHVEKFLFDLGYLSRTPPVAELTLVPGGAVPRGAAMSGAAERRREGDFVRVIRVQAPQTKGGDRGSKGNGPSTASSEKGGRSRFDDEDRNGRYNDDGYEEDEDGFPVKRSGSGFDEWGRFDTDEGAGSANQKDWWYFRDEAMAYRLANYLRPAPDLDRKHTQAVVTGRSPLPASPTSPASTSSGNKESGGWRWGRKKEKPVEDTRVASPMIASPLLSPGEREGASMTARAEEVTFRTENDFGIYESLTGWGIVVTVKVRSLR